MTHFGVRLSEWELDVVAKMCLTPFGANSSSASLEAGLAGEAPEEAETSQNIWLCDSWNIYHSCEGRWRWCPRKDQRGLQGALNLRRGLRCAMRNLNRACWEAPRPNAGWKTSSIVMLLGPFPRARLGTAVGMVWLPHHEEQWILQVVMKKWCEYRDAKDCSRNASIFFILVARTGLWVQKRKCCGMTCLYGRPGPEKWNDAVWNALAKLCVGRLHFAFLQQTWCS